MKKILVTGGTGFIGSHTVVSLLKSGHQVVILDNLCNSSINILPRLKTITGQEIPFYQGDIRDREILRRIFAENRIDSVIHFAGLKAVGESVAEPMKYYDNNVSGSLVLAEEMARAGVFKIVFSSSATVYGDPGKVPYTEDMQPGDTTSPYGTSKSMVERILTDIQKADPRWSVILLRYFNPIGAHESGLIGEQPNGIPNNLLPYICQVASGRLPQLSVFGGDYPTPDGTGMRDYIHVMDLAEGHVAAMQAKSNVAGTHLLNLGSGRASSVLEIIRAFEAASGLTIPFEIKPRRAGDLACSFADPSHTKQQTGWETKRGLQQMMEDSWRWVSRNPNGYGD
ncbi:UDP-glucose 4-epimerase (galactowaldenase%3B UDP-galactose 4-epimerase) [Neisseria meningitidis]|uniref:UDP-glucose 4-epimerase GalE n=1 Tax=Neisseria meningitidis TaxID=487 RepID=UPI000766C1F5|nr:UDP-glucose 4-epimerase GalE [Neisseria meningitidis]CWM78386.1 UDP-glucose 4-epimerase (galactowaldenase%3B UDP-galactose 4-epimerase) [Neisseria meningitidis]CWM83465.1 UDP-glucose 4-epimerase (galactowaldenase%3B UDP-galactose 4-epimerase) [Neisseria meningitidis]CWN76028.1 UDP-glucose 4-epimerase (galactowaldenase%3B UDP-galactose 4-epimerase) [Neisseria meningitidis]CWQ74330.1 UDP-glucose 4-epimerase (galactowaldenase%3B UDP-galactose 4-epimerase) [Neisseria meningitidis]CWR08351.1 UDP